MNSYYDCIQEENLPAAAPTLLQTCLRASIGSDLVIAEPERDRRVMRSAPHLVRDLRAHVRQESCHLLVISCCKLQEKGYHGPFVSSIEHHRNEDHYEYQSAWRPGRRVNSRSR